MQVATDEADLRLDRWFRRHFPGLRHGDLERLLRTGQIRVNGRRAKSGHRLSARDEIRIPPPVVASSIPPRIGAEKTLSDEDRTFIQSLVLHRDEHIIVLNKPSGLAVQGGAATIRHVDALLGGLTFGSRARPRLVHRLDKDTSGILLLARSATVAAHLAEVFRDKSARKTYWALVVGVPEPRQGTIESDLAKVGPQGRERILVVDKGRSSYTRYRVLQTSEGLAWLEMSPITGRTHQLRVHALECGTPIVGDLKYGGSRAVLDCRGISSKLHLHARTLEFPHPAGGRFSVTAPLPPHMRATWDILGFRVEEDGN